MTIHRFGSPEAALAHFECDTCTRRESDIPAALPHVLYMKRWKALTESNEFSSAVTTKTPEAEIRARVHERNTGGEHTIILFYHDNQHRLPEKDAAAIKELNVNQSLAALADAYAQFNS